MIKRRNETKNYDRDEIFTLALQELKEDEDEIFDVLHTFGVSDVLEELAESYGYKVYGGDSYKDNALVLNVKGRPDITNEKVSELLEEHYDYLYDDIQFFAQNLNDEFPLFTVRGRMDGYWGLSDFDNNIEITEDGYEKMADKFTDLIIREIEEDEDFEDIRDYQLYYIFRNNRDEIVEVLDSENSLKIKDNYLKDMQELEKFIDEQEKYFNSDDYAEEIEISLKEQE